MEGMGAVLSAWGADTSKSMGRGFKCLMYELALEVLPHWCLLLS